MLEYDFMKTGDCSAYLETFRESLKKDDWLRYREVNTGTEVRFPNPKDPANRTAVEEAFARMLL